MKPWRTNTSPPSRISTWPWASAALPWPPCPRPSRPRPTSPGGLRPPQPMPRINQPDLVLQVSTRTVARLLAELRAYGYIATTHRLGTLGQTIGLRVELLDPLLPYFERAVTELSPLVIPKIHKVSEKPALIRACV